MFQEYPQERVNEPIALYQGKFRVHRGGRVIEGAGSAALKWLPAPSIEIEIETPAPDSAVDFDSRVELPGFRTENPLVHSIRTGPTCRIGACVSLLESADDHDLVSVGFQVANLSDIITRERSAAPGDPTTVTCGRQRTERLLDGAGAVTHETARLRHDGWQADLVAVPESADVYESLKASGGYGFTHVGQLTRADGSPFTAQQADTILESLTAFLSFAHGTACSLPIRRGRGTTGEVVWRQFGSPVVNRWTRGRTSWFDEHHGALLTELFDAFCRMYNDRTLREPLVVALHWYRHCNTQSSGTEGSLVLGMGALDLLSALVVVDRCRSMPANRHDKLGVAEKLRGLLKALGVPADIPSRYASLATFARENDQRDSCGALAEFSKRTRPPQRETQEHRAPGRRPGVVRGVAVVALVSGTGVALPAGSSGALQESDDRRMGGRSGAGTVEQWLWSGSGRATRSVIGRRALEPVMEDPPFVTPEAATLHGEARRRLLEADGAWRPTPPELIARHLPYPCRWPCELGPPEAFSDEPGPADYFDLWPDHDPACMGAESEAVARRIASSCAGWPHRPTGQEFYDALRAERPTTRQRAIVGMWAVEASRLDMLDAHGERVYSWRRLVAALHRCGPFATFATFRWLNRRALVPEYDGVRLWSG